MRIKIMLLAMAATSLAFAQTPPDKSGSVSTWAEQNVLINPFSAKPLSAEQIQAELEAARLHTQLLEEQLKQTNISAEIRNVPLRKSVEASQAETAVKKEEVSRAQIAQALKQAQNPPPAAPPASAGKPVSAPPETAPKPAPKPAPKAVPKPAQEAAKPAEAAKKPAPVQPTLVSIVTVGNRKSAVIDVQGASLVVADGGMTPFGPVVIMDDSSANIGGRTYAVHGATISRFVSSDVAPPEPPKPGNAPVSAGFGATPASAAQAQPVPSPAAPARNQLPPLMLPPGVSVLPQPN